MCLTGEARLLGYAERVHMVHERDCGEMGHISYRLVLKWKPTKVRDSQLESQSQYLWILNMWHTSLPTNLQQVHLQIIWPLRDHKKGSKPYLDVSNIEKHVEVGRWLQAVHNLANWHTVYLFVF